MSITRIRMPQMRGHGKYHDWIALVDKQRMGDAKVRRTSETPPTSSKKSWLRSALGYFFAAACLVWVFHDVDVRQVWLHIRNVDPWWIAVAILCNLLAYVCQGLRWSVLLRPVGRVTTSQSTQAIYAGHFASGVLPLKAGELVRAYIVARWLQVKMAAIIPSMLVERFFDGVWLALGLIVTMIFVPLPRSLLEAGDILGILLVMATGMFFYVIARPNKTITATTTLSENRPFDSGGGKHSHWIGGIFDGLMSGLRAIGFSLNTGLAFAASSGLLLLQALAFWLVMYAYGLRLSFFVGAAIFLIMHFGTALPNAPANVGSYQFFTVVGLSLFGVDKTYAAGFSVVVFVLLTLPLSLLGFVSLSRSGTTLFTVREDINRFYSKW